MAMAVQVAATSSFGFSSKSSKYRYDVFLSFRGEDTRNSFTANLYDALRHKGINAFIDDKKLGKGERIAPALLKAIEKSRISMIVFSTNYATSTWCLDELAHIIQCKKEKNQLVMPIFYKVDPMDVQYQLNSFEEAMANHEERFRNDAEKDRNSFEEDSAAYEDRLRKNLEKLQKWRFALFETARLSSAWLLEDGYNEGVFIESIVEDAYARLPPKRFYNVHYIVGLKPRIEEAMSLLNESDNSICMLGIHGTGGIGKTTLAKAIYNSIFYHFEGYCFLFDVKEASKKYQGVVRLQQKLLSEILEEKIMMFGSVDEGISRIKHRLSHKKVLLVLDDVDEVDQLEHLAGGCDWFGYGSKIIITTRNKQLLIACNVEKTYEMMKLNEHDSLELFCWHAFHKSQPPKNYQDMSSCAISYAQGLPLALRVIGSNLADVNFEKWRSILKQYERIPEKTINEVLKVSYNCLQDGAKNIFLDIACFIDEKMLDSIEEIVEACDSGARFYLEGLVDKSLITFDDNDCFFMHDLIRKMGREIVRQEAPLNPKKCSRLWCYKDILEVLRENLGCNNIEGIMLDPPQQEKVEWSGVAFEQMNNLRILVIRNVRFSTGPTYLPNSLRWLEWEGYPSTTLPKDFSPSELVFLKLPQSSFIPKEPFKRFTNHVTQMNFSHCKFIIEVPDLSQLQSLRILNFACCRNLIKIHDSLGFLSKLVRLYVTGCTKLSSFPREIKMASLEYLNLNYCKSLEYFPHVVGSMDALEMITMEKTAIKRLPPSIGNLPRLKGLSISSCRSHTKNSLMKLIMQDIQPMISSYYMKLLSLGNCGLLDEELSLILNCFPNLQELILSRNDFVSIPKGIKEFAKLRQLNVSDCKKLRDIPELPSKLRCINAENCTSLTAESLDSLYSQAKKKLSDLYICMPTTNTTFPDWFNYCCEGDTLCFRARRNLSRGVLAFEFGKRKKANTRVALLFLVSMSINGRKIRLDDIGSDDRSLIVKEGHVILDGPLLRKLIRRKQNELNRFKGLDWNDVELQFIIDSRDVSLVRCGFYMHKQQSDMENAQFKPPLLSRASLKRRAITSPPNEPPNKFLRTTRTIKRRKTFRSSYRRNMAFPMDKHVWRFLYH